MNAIPTAAATDTGLKVKQVGNRYFAWSPRALRWLPVAKAKVVFQ